MHFNNLQRTEANLLHSICVGGECKTDTDGNSLVQQCASLQAVTGSIISLSHDALWLQCLKTSRQGREYLEFIITVSSERLEKAAFWLNHEDYAKKAKEQLSYSARQRQRLQVPALCLTSSTTCSL